MLPRADSVFLVALLPEVPKDLLRQEVGLCFARPWNERKTKATLTGLVRGRVWVRSKVSGRCPKTCRISWAVKIGFLPPAFQRVRRKKLKDKGQEGQ